MMQSKRNSESFTSVLSVHSGLDPDDTKTQVSDTFVNRQACDVKATKDGIPITSFKNTWSDAMCTAELCSKDTAGMTSMTDKDEAILKVQQA